MCVSLIIFEQPAKWPMSTQRYSEYTIDTPKYKIQNTKYKNKEQQTIQFHNKQCAALNVAE